MNLIAQQEEICSQCGCTIYPGEYCETDGWGSVQCSECYNNNLRGEIYG